MHPSITLWRQNVDELAALIPKLTVLEPGISQLCQLLLESWRAGGKALFAGNGGSAADAMHFAEELMVRFQKNRAALPAIALCDATTITCAGNDFGYDEIFARQVAGLGKKGDVLVLLSTSGNSKNIIRAWEVASRLGVRTVLLSGKGGGSLKGRCDVELIVPSDITHHVQEVHKMIYHAVCQYIDTQVD